MNYINRDRKEFCRDFGADAGWTRIELPRLGCFGTELSIVIFPESTKEETLGCGWERIQALARWIIGRAADFPVSERYIVIVGWSREVRPAQGQIFKAGGTMEEIRMLATADDWSRYEQTTGHRILLAHWSKDVFPR